MPTALSDLPRDENGAVTEPMRLVHHDPGFTEGYPGVRFVDGVSVAPISGNELIRLVSVMGDHFDVQPWDAPVVRSELADEVTAEPEPPAMNEPEQPHEAADAAGLPDNLPALRAMATAKGIDVDGRWGVKKLQRAIRRHDRGMPC